MNMIQSLYISPHLLVFTNISWTICGLIELVHIKKKNLVHTRRTHLKVLPTRHTTKYDGVYFKEIIAENGKVVDKQYIIRWRDENGKDRLKTIGKHSEGVRPPYCKNKRDEIVVKLRLGEDAPHLAKKKSGITFDECADKYFSDRSHLVKESHKEKQRYLNHIKIHIGHKPMENVSIQDVEDLQKLFMKTLAPRTVNHLMFLVGTVFKHAIKKGLYSGTSPTIAIDGLKVDNARDKYLNTKEVEKLLKAAEMSHYEVWLFVKLSLSTGGRVSTIMDIKAKDIKLENNSVTLRDHKSAKTYTGFYDDDLKSILAERAEALKPNEPVIRLHRHTIEQKLRGLLDVLFNLDLEKDDSKNRTVIHTLRHTFASHLAINGVDILTIKKLMNHASIEMTMRYAHLSPDKGSDAVKSLYK